MFTKKDTLHLPHIPVEGFTKEEAAEIKDTCAIFQHVSVAPSAQDWKWIRFNGEMFGKKDLDYVVLPHGPFSINVQVMKKGNLILYDFGIIITKDSNGNIIEFMPYHDNMA
jgi:hypothetical protein